MILQQLVPPAAIDCFIMTFVVVKNEDHTQRISEDMHETEHSKKTMTDCK